MNRRLPFGDGCANEVLHALESVLLKASVCCQRQKRNSSWREKKKKMLATLVVRHEYRGIVMEREGTESGCQACVEAAQSCPEVAEMQNEA